MSREGKLFPPIPVLKNSAIAQDHHKKLTDLAIAWVLRQPALTGAIMGIRSEHEALEMAGGVNWKLTGQEIQAIDQALTLWS